MTNAEREARALCAASRRRRRLLAAQRERRKDVALLRAKGAWTRGLRAQLAASARVDLGHHGAVAVHLQGLGGARLELAARCTRCGGMIRVAQEFARLASEADRWRRAQKAIRGHFERAKALHSCS